jgi:hypothetical protein
MWLTILITVVLVVVVFGFVLEPIIRGRPDHVEPDAIAIPDALDAVELSDGGVAQPVRSEPHKDAPQPEYATEVGQAEPGS